MILLALRRFPLLLVAAAASAAQAPAPPAPVTAVAKARLQRVLIDEPGDGNVWVLAPGYKARFGRDGVEFIPYFGPRAARNHPMTFRLRGVQRGAVALALIGDAPPVVDGARVVYERGAVREVWELREREVEQTFVVADMSGRGELVVDVAVAAEVPCEDGADGLTFAHPGLGTVHYGDLTALRAGGGACTAPSRWNGDGIELRVPAAFADAATGPLTVDPVVRALSIEVGTGDDFDPDVAYEPTTDRWLVVYERAFSSIDHDIIAQRYSGEGNVIDEVAVATGTRESFRPAVAANGPARQFLVAWDEDSGIADRVIRGRTRDAASTTQGATFTIRDSSGTLVEDRRPTVGGSSSTDLMGDRYFVANEVWTGSTPGRIQITRITTAGTNVGTFAAGSIGEQATDPVVTKSRPTNGRWLLAYVSNGTNGEIRAELHIGENAIGIPQIVESARSFIGPPAVAADGFDYAVAFSHRINAGDNNIRLAHLQFARGVLSVVSNIDLTAIEPNAIIANDQRAPAISSDGCRFTCTYLESSGVAGNYEAYAAVFRLLPAVQFSDSHRLLHAVTPNAPERNLVIASEGEIGGDAGRYLVAWDIEFSTSSHDVAGCLFDGTENTIGVTTVSTACGGIFAPTLTVQNPPALGATLRVRASEIQPSAQVYLVGLPSLVALCSAGCRLGVLPILLSVPGTALNLPIGCDTNLLGARLAIQNVFAGGPLGCTTANFPIPFNVSDTIVVRVQ